MKAIRSNLFFYLFAPSSLVILIAGMGCQGIGNSTLPPSKILTAVSVSPATASVSMGSTQQFTATAKYSDGSTANVSSTASWAVGSSAIATISSSGLVTGKASGSTSVTASLSGMTGTASLDVQTVTVTKTLKSIAVTPATVSLAPGATQQFTATATYSDGSTANISTSATWISASPSIATINSSGLATGVAGGSTMVSASLSGISSNAATISVVALTSISVTPSSVSVSVGGAEQFTATASYSNGTQGNVTSSASWSVSQASVAHITSSGVATGISVGATGVTASLDGFSGSATLDVTASTGTGANIPMFHVDQNRSGLNSNETILTPNNVTPANFGKLFSYLVDGYVYGQPLVISNLTIGGTTHNVLFAATENDTVYAFDADSNAGSNASPLWKTSLLQAGETPITNGPIQPVEGITSTPAIDTTTNTMYVVSAQSSASGGTFRLNALDITTGNQQPGSPITLQATVAGTNDTTLSTDCLQRAALLVLPGPPASVFIGFGSCHSGWLLAYTYDGASFTQTGVFNSSPNLTGEGPYASAGGVWMGGGGPVSDGNYVYVTTGNGPWDPSQQAYGDSVLKFTQSLQLEDYFTPFVYAYMDCADADLAAGGLLLIPGTTELLAGGKTGKLYLINSDNLRQEQNNDTGATQTLWFEDDLSPHTRTPAPILSVDLPKLTPTKSSAPPRISMGPSIWA